MTFFRDCGNVIVNNGTFIVVDHTSTRHQTRRAAPEGDSSGGVVIAQQQPSSAQQRPSSAQRRPSSAQRRPSSAQRQPSSAQQQVSRVQQQVSRARQQAYDARQQARKARQQAREARQGTWMAWLFGNVDYDSTDSEGDDDSDVDHISFNGVGMEQRISLNGVRVEQRIGRRMGRERDVEILSQAEERAQDAGQREVQHSEFVERTRILHGSDISITGFNRSRGRPHSGVSVSFINNRRSTTGSQTSPPKAKPQSQSAPKTLYTERHESAASLIQRNFRIHRSFRAVHMICLEFQMVKDTFVYPRVIGIQVPGKEGHISLRVYRVPSEFDEAEVGKGGASNESQPKLARTSVNFPIHSHKEELEKLLVRLDGIESWGDKGVREKRRLAVKEVGKESAKLERCWKRAWIDHLEKKQREGMRVEEARTVGINGELGSKDLDDDDDDEWFEVQ